LIGWSGLLDERHSFTVRHAVHVVRDRVLYLDCWCEETTGDWELAHNHTFRLDRLVEPELCAIAGDWRPDLDTLLATFELRGDAAIAYHPHPRDREDGWHAGTRRVVRAVTDLDRFCCELLPDAIACLEGGQLLLGK